MTEIIYEINYYRKLNYTKEETKNKQKEQNIPNSKSKSLPVMNRKETHKKWGHQYKDNCDKMAKYMGIKFQGTIDHTGFGLVKSIEKLVTKVIQRKATKSIERICIDTAGPYPANPCGTRYWMCALDDFVYMYWLHFTKIKSEMVKFV